MSTTEKNKAGSSLERGFDMLNKWCCYIAGYMILVMAFIITYDVIMRYLFSKPTSWALDFTGYLMVYSTFLAAGWLLKENIHVRITLFTDLANESIQRVLTLVINVIGVIVSAFICWQGIQEVWYYFVNNQVIVRPVAVPKFLVFLPIPFGALMLLGYFILFIRKDMQNFLKK